MPVLCTLRRTVSWRPLLLAFAGLGLPCFLFAAARQASTSQSDTKPAQQPIPFSHKQHVGFDMKCQECHPNPDPGDRMTLPRADRCMECHRTIAKDRPSIQMLAGFAKSKEPVPWVRVYVVSAWVFWNHRSHLEAGMKCESCHGDVGKMDRVVRATNVNTMAGCVDCHKKNDASTGCQFCHSGK
jgi:hypothetical protein